MTSAMDASPAVLQATAEPVRWAVLTVPADDAHDRMTAALPGSLVSA